MSSTTGGGSCVLGTTVSGTATRNLVHSSSKSPSGLQGTPRSLFTISAAAFWLSGSLLKDRALTTVPSVVPTKLSLVRRHLLKAPSTFLCAICPLDGSSCCRLSTAPAH
eukprot:188743-Amphidinium_carterae.1